MIEVEDYRGVHHINMMNQGEGEDCRIEKEEEGYRGVYHINIMN